MSSMSTRTTSNGRRTGSTSFADDQELADADELYNGSADPDETPFDETAPPVLRRPRG